jgi:hypothetical protein
VYSFHLIIQIFKKKRGQFLFLLKESIFYIYQHLNVIASLAYALLVVIYLLKMPPTQVEIHGKTITSTNN